MSKDKIHIDTKDFYVKEGSKVNLKKWSTDRKPLYKSKDHVQSSLAKHVEELSSFQNVMYADNRYALLVIFQAMDAAGKDSAIKHVMSGTNPQGCQVFSFKHPSSVELDHDFLWRTTCSLPERGRIGIFNRSYYEEVLIAKVHPDILEAQKIPTAVLNKKTIWQQRYRSINNLETHLHHNGTKVLKIFLHLSKEEQRQRFLSRIDDPSKNWKFSVADMPQRKCWKEYMKAYEECLSATSTHHAPWYIVPADDKCNAQLIISQVIIDTLKSLKMSYPKLSAKEVKELKAVRKELVKNKE